MRIEYYPQTTYEQIAYDPKSKIGICKSDSTLSLVSFFSVGGIPMHPCENPHETISPEYYHCSLTEKQWSNLKDLVVDQNITEVDKVFEKLKLQSNNSSPYYKMTNDSIFEKEIRINR